MTQFVAISRETLAILLEVTETFGPEYPGEVPPEKGAEITAGMNEAREVLEATRVFRMPAGESVTRPSAGELCAQEKLG